MADHHQAWLSSNAAGAGQSSDRGSGNDNKSNHHRPSFAGYWQGEKELERTGRVQFVNEGHPTAASSSSPLETPPPPQQQSHTQASLMTQAAGTGVKEKEKEKARLRRQQVRKAQIQHRTRKANYTKQLELDITHFRDMIAAAEREVLSFRRQNEGMRDILKARGLRVPEETKGKGNDIAVAEARIAEDDLVEELLALEKETQPSVLVPEQQQPCPSQVHHDHHQHYISSSEPPLAYEQQPIEYDLYPPVDMFSSDAYMADVTVTMRKDDTLGTPCFQISSSSFSNIAEHTRPATPDQLSPDQEVIAINLILAMEHICWNHFHPRQFPRHGDPCKAASGHTMMASTMCMSTAPERVYRSIRRREIETQHTWQASGAGSSLSLKSLLSLARSLNPGDIELTPVQAWFELAGRYGTAALMEDRVIEALKREFSGVVDCIHFGAIIERDAFESVVTRVMAEVGVTELEYEMDLDVGIGDSGATAMHGSQQAGTQQVAA